METLMSSVLAFVVAHWIELAVVSALLAAAFFSGRATKKPTVRERVVVHEPKRAQGDLQAKVNAQLQNVIAKGKKE